MAQEDININVQNITTLDILTRKLFVIFRSILDCISSLRKGEVDDGSLTAAKLDPSIGYIEESGENTNGHYTKFSDGTLICTHTITLAPITQSFGALFRSNAETTWTYPSPFISAPQVSGNDVNSNQILVGGRSNSSEANFIGIFVQSLAGNRTALITATGRWK